VIAVDDFSLTVHGGSTLGIIGPNGAGKTTLINLISGLEKPDEGQIFFRGTPIQGQKANVISRMGIGRTFQTVRIFGELTVHENLQIADLFTKPSSGRSFEERATDLLQLVNLEDYAPTKAQELSYGQKKLLELAMVLMMAPALLLLDEPVAGVNPVLVAKIRALLGQLVEQGLTLVVIEHNVPFVVDCCQTVLVMSDGRKLAEGPGTVIQRDKRVLEAFLGGR
jgi:ABC-type branched-subunit amino acid transport system ATPase component